MKPEDIRNVTVVGAGLMGHGIAQEFALAGYRVSLYDLTDEKLRKAMTSIEDNLRLMTDLGLVDRTQWNSVLRNIHPHTALEKSVADADVVIEAVFEELDLKQDVFRRLDAACPVRTILASNSSTLLPSKLATATSRPDRVLVAHYLNPPYLIPLVELVRHPGTSDATVAVMCDLLKKVGKQPASAPERDARVYREPLAGGGLARGAVACRARDRDGRGCRSGRKKQLRPTLRRRPVPSKSGSWPAGT